VDPLREAARAPRREAGPASTRARTARAERYASRLLPRGNFTPPAVPLARADVVFAVLLHRDLDVVPAGGIDALDDVLEHVGGTKIVEHRPEHLADRVVRAEGQELPRGRRNDLGQAGRHALRRDAGGSLAVDGDVRGAGKRIGRAAAALRQPPRHIGARANRYDDV